MSLFPLASLPLILLCHGGGYGDPGYPNIFNPPTYFCLPRMRTRSALSLNRRPSHTGSVTMHSGHCHRRIDSVITCSPAHRRISYPIVYIYGGTLTNYLLLSP